MARSLNLNVFKGPDSVKDYFNPDLNPPLPLIEIPNSLNPLRRHGVRIYAKMMTALPAQNVKLLPALNMLQNQPDAASKSIVEASSGSTVLSLSMLSHVLYGKDDVCAYVTNKKHPDSLKLLRFFGLKVAVYGGLAQQDPDDPRGIMSRLRERNAREEDLCYLGQYDNDNNWRAHVRWTGPQIWQQLPEINVFCTTVGTGGAITGTGVYLKSEKPSVRVIGVCNAFGDPTPGPRHFPGFESSPFPWRTTIDEFQTVTSVDSYRMSMKLCRNGIIAGPSSGEALVGLIQSLTAEWKSGRLAKLAEPETGEISCVFMCCDLPYQYIDGYYQKLDEVKDFPPIVNQDLLHHDTYRYDERWEIKPEQALSSFFPNSTSLSIPSVLEQYVNAHLGDNSVDNSKTTSLTTSSSRSPSLTSTSSDCFLPSSPSPSCTSSVSSAHSIQESEQACSSNLIIDLRQPEDFEATHLPGAINSPLAHLTSSTGDIYGDDELLKLTWTALNEKFANDEVLQEKLSSARATNDGEKADGVDDAGVTVFVTCYDGEPSRMATSVLRHFGYEAYSIFGGMNALRKMLSETV